MRRITAMVALVAAVLLAGCSSDSTTSESTGTTAAAGAGSGSVTTMGGTTATTKASGTSTGSFADVCKARNLSTPPAPSQGSVNFSQAVTDFQFAVDHAPAEIKADMQTLASALVPYFQLLAGANGNFVAAAQNPQFAQLAQKFQQADFQAASQRIAAWYASHCS